MRAARRCVVTFVLLTVSAGLVVRSLGDAPLRLALPARDAPAVAATSSSELPAVSVHYFRSASDAAKARVSVFVDGGTVLSATISRFGTASPTTSIPRGLWAQSPGTPSMQRAAVRLPPGRYRLHVLVNTGVSHATIDRILDVPSFSERTLGLSSVIASARGADHPRVKGRFHCGQPVVASVNVYVPPRLRGVAGVSVRFTLRRGEAVVRETVVRLDGLAEDTAVVEDFDTSALDSGPYQLRASLSAPESVTEVSSLLEFFIDNAT